MIVKETCFGELTQPCSLAQVAEEAYQYSGDHSYQTGTSLASRAPSLLCRAPNGPSVSSRAPSGPSLSSRALSGPSLSSRALSGPSIASHAPSVNGVTSSSVVDIKQYLIGNDLYGCPFCGKVFRNNNFRPHLMTHTGEKPYMCRLILRIRNFVEQWRHTVE